VSSWVVILLFEKAKVYKYIETTIRFAAFYAQILSICLSIPKNASFLKKNTQNNKEIPRKSRTGISCTHTKRYRGDKVGCFGDTQ
jgi:hypothetical protein